MNKLSKEIANQYDIVVIEDINMQDMAKESDEIIVTAMPDKGYYLSGKQHLAVDMGQRIALGGYGLNKDVFKQWFLFTVSHINIYTFRPRGALNAL